MKKALDWFVDKFVFYPLEVIYSIVCGELDCTFCTFYRGVILGGVLGVGLTVALVAADIISL